MLDLNLNVKWSPVSLNDLRDLPRIDYQSVKVINSLSSSPVFNRGEIDWNNSSPAVNLHARVVYLKETLNVAKSAKDHVVRNRVISLFA